MKYLLQHFRKLENNHIVHQTKYPWIKVVVKVVKGIEICKRYIKTDKGGEISEIVVTI